MKASYNITNQIGDLGLYGEIELEVVEKEVGEPVIEFSTDAGEVLTADLKAGIEYGVHYFLENSDSKLNFIQSRSVQVNITRVNANPVDSSGICIYYRAGFACCYQFQPDKGQNINYK